MRQARRDTACLATTGLVRDHLVFASPRGTNGRNPMELLSRRHRVAPRAPLAGVNGDGPPGAQNARPHCRVRRVRIAQAIVRFLAHGGAPRTERARLGTWPEIPSGLLLDVRGIAREAPAFGLGMLQTRPFLIYRELNDEGPDAPAYSFLLEPRPEDFERFRWNAAWLLASLLADESARRLLIEEPELVTTETLTGLLDRCAPLDLQTARVPKVLAGQLTRAALEQGRFRISPAHIGLEERPYCMDFAAALEGVPVAFRTSRGWLVGGMESHAEILGCAVLLGEPSAKPADPAPGLAALARLEGFAGSNAEVARLLATPWSDWGTQGQALIHGLKILDELEAQPTQALELLGSVPAREGLLAAEIRSAARRIMQDSSAALEFTATTLLLEEAEAEGRQVAPATLERLDRGALLHFFCDRGIPPAPWPAWIEILPDLKAELWARLLASAENGWADIATRALEDIAPEGARSDAALEVVLVGIQAARERGDGPLEWEGFASLSVYPELPPLLALWARDEVPRMRGDWQTAYLLLGGDPGGSELNQAKVSAPVAGRLVTAICEALEGPHHETARTWLESLARSPLRDRVPMKTKLKLPTAAGGRWAALGALRQAYEGASGSADAASPDEHPFLQRELEALAKQKPGSPPDVSALRAVFGGELPEHTQRVLSRWTKSSEPDGPHESHESSWLAGVAERLRMGKAPQEATPVESGPEEEEKLPAASAEPVPPSIPAAEPARAEPSPVTDDAPALMPDPQPQPGLQPEQEPQPEPVVDEEPSPDLEEHVREWILGGDAEDDRRADEELTRLFEESSERQLAAVRAALEGFNSGILYRLAARAACHPRLLDGVARAADAEMLDQIVSDAADYDPQGLARQAAERLRCQRREGPAGAVDESIRRLLRSRQRDTWDGLIQEFRAIDEALLPELLGDD